MKPGKLTGLVAEFSGFIGKPFLPLRGDLVMADLRRIADVER